MAKGEGKGEYEHDLFSPRWRPEGFDIGKLTSVESAVLSILRYHIGHARALVVEELAAAVKLEKRKLRDVLKHMSETHDIGICSTPMKPWGIYLVETLEEEEEYLKREMGRALSVLRRISRHKRSHYARLAGQAALQLEEVK